MNAEQQARSLFDQFILLHPNSNEEYSPTLQNMQRWAWHVKQAAGRPAYDEVKKQIPEKARRIAESRSFKNFYDMPEYMKDRYLQIAAMFPGLQFYACGSRVRGEYIDKFSGKVIADLRRKLQKQDREESDYDVFVEDPVKRPKHLLSKRKDSDTWKPKATYGGYTVQQIRDQLPEWADVLFAGVPDNEKVPIPMWDFTRLPKDKHAEVIELFNNQRWGLLMQIHNDYALSPNVYCCNEAPIIRYFTWAIENGKIKADAEPEKTADKVDN